jgi:outer membrane protein TolC
MQFRQLILAASALVIAGASPALGQGSPAPIAGDSALQSLVAEALARNPTVAQRQAAVRAATLRIRPAGTLPDPMFEVGTIDPSQQFHGFSQIQFELVQEIPWPGLLGAHASLARAVETQARAGVGAARREVTTAVAAAYYRLRYLVTALRTIADQRGLLDAAAQLSMTRYATGAAPQSDPLQAKLARDRLDGERFVLQGEYAAAVAALNALRDRPTTDSLAITTLDAAAIRTSVSALPATDSLLAAAVAAHPRLAARRAALAQAGRQVQVERLQGRPDFFLRFDYQHNGSVPGFKVPDYPSAFFGVRLPVWAWRKQNSLADAARADSTAAAAEFHDTEAQLRREVVETAARVEASRRRLELLVDGILPAAQATVESVLRSYQVGRAEFLTLLSVEDARYRAELEAVAVAADYQAQLVMLRQLTAGEGQP